MRLTLYTRPGCRLCDEMKAVVRAVRGQAARELTEVDVSQDEDLLRRYGRDVPVLLADGVEVARARIGAVELRKILAAGTDRGRAAPARDDAQGPDAGAGAADAAPETPTSP